MLSCYLLAHWNMSCPAVSFFVFNLLSNLLQLLELAYLTHTPQIGWPTEMSHSPPSSCLEVQLSPTLNAWLGPAHLESRLWSLQTWSLHLFATMRLSRYHQEVGLYAFFIWLSVPYAPRTRPDKTSPPDALPSQSPSILPRIDSSNPSLMLS